MKKSAIDIIRQITLEVEDPAVTHEMMMRDIYMMKFKIRSHIGDISQLEAKQQDFIKALWKIAKADDIISESIYELDEDDQDALIQYFNMMEDRIHENMQHSLRKLGKRSGKMMRRLPFLKVEIYKEFPILKHLN